MLARHYYGFTEEELDFIINYDIKYRMGREGSMEDDVAVYLAHTQPGGDMKRVACLLSKWGGHVLES